MDSKVKAKLREFLKNNDIAQALAFIEAVETTGASRTGVQNNSLHLWFEWVAQACRDNQIDVQMVLSKSFPVEMNATFIKGMWKTIQEARLKKASTTELRKTGEIDIIRDHMIRYFSDKWELELPPFPNDKLKALEENQGYKTGGKLTVDYPEYNGASTL